jgi:hypothetical protein
MEKLVENHRPGLGSREQIRSPIPEKAFNNILSTMIAEDLSK